MIVTLVPETMVVFVVVSDEFAANKAPGVTVIVAVGPRGAPLVRIFKVCAVPEALPV